MKISITILPLVLSCAMAHKILEEEVSARFREEIRLIRTSLEAIHATMKEANTGCTNRLDNLEKTTAGILDDVASELRSRLDKIQIDTSRMIDEKMKGVEEKLEKAISGLDGRLVDLESDFASLKLELGIDTVTFLRRQDGSVNFTRSWSEYRDGFGDPAGEFWLGLFSLHRLTTQTRYRLRVDLVDWSGETKWAEYGHFAVGPASDNYRLNISDYATASTAGDGVIRYRLNGMAFTTIDQDNDLNNIVNCAAQNGGGGWWYSSCGYAWLTGQYKPARYRSYDGILWYPAYDDWRSFKAASLKLVPVYAP